MLGVLIFIVALIVLRPILAGRKLGSSGKDSPYGNSLDGMLSPAQVSDVLDDFEGLRIHGTQHPLAH